jgi:hypothetical protein
MHVYTWQEPGIEGMTKVYDYSILKNNLVYSVMFVVDTTQDASTKSIRDAVFNSIKIRTLGQGATS